MSEVDIDRASPAVAAEDATLSVGRLAKHNETEPQTQHGPEEPDLKTRRTDGHEDTPPVNTKPTEHDYSPTPYKSHHHPPTTPLPTTDRASAVLRIEHNMCRQLPRTSFISGKVTHVYNPLEHAAAPHCHYVRLCLSHGLGVPFLMVGMNPGPWGMSQTGVPFGEVAAVRDWMRVEGEVVPPEEEHPQRRVAGFSCNRSEVGVKC